MSSADYSLLSTARNASFALDAAHLLHPFLPSFCFSRRLALEANVAAVDFRSRFTIASRLARDYFRAIAADGYSKSAWISLISGIEGGLSRPPCRVKEGQRIGGFPHEHVGLPIASVTPR